MAEPLNLKEQIQIAASLAEGQFREFKTAYAGAPGQKIKRLVKDICKDVGEALVAFANADGGELIIGVEDDGTITGTNAFSDKEVVAIKDAWRSHVHMKTPLQSVLSRDINVDGLRIVYFRIPKGTKYVHSTSDGRCLKRNDLETIPMPPEQIQFDRREVASREYDKEFVDGATPADLDTGLLEAVANQVSPGISTDKCLQYLGLAEYDAYSGLRLRRAALLLFAKNCDKWHPRLQVRILRVNGNELGAGSLYNVSDDVTIKKNILSLIDEAWDGLRPYLVATRFQEDARFRVTYIYPEIACREALVNAIAHRDYSEEGRGIEIYVFDNRIEVANPGGLLSSMSLAEVMALKGVHQSRNSYVARTLREAGVMRELGEGMRRMFEIMRNSELAPPDVAPDSQSFILGLYHRPMYSKEESLWLDQYEIFSLNVEEKSILLLGRKGELISPNNIINRLGIVDTERYRQLVHSLQIKGVLETAVPKSKASSQARRKGIGVRDVARFKIRLARDAEKTVHDRELKVDRTKPVLVPTKKSAPKLINRALYATNIPPNTNDRDVAFAFKEFGVPANIVIPRANGLSRGYAYI